MDKARLRLEEAKCIIAPQQATLDNCKILAEPPFVLTKQFRPDLPVKIGAFTKIHGPGLLGWVDIGRYCSIAPNAVLGGNAHPVSWLSTSAVFEAPDMEGWAQASFTQMPAVSKFFDGAVSCIKVGHDVWIGDGAFVRNGVQIGHGAVIGARSVVTRDVSPYSIVAGNPAKTIRMRFSKEVIERLLDFSWWRFDHVTVSRADVRDPLAAVSLLQKQEDDGIIYPYAPLLVRTGGL